MVNEMTNWERIGMTEKEYKERYGTIDGLQMVADKWNIPIEIAYIRLLKTENEDLIALTQMWWATRRAVDTEAWHEVTRVGTRLFNRLGIKM